MMCNEPQRSGGSTLASGFAAHAFCIGLGLSSDHKPLPVLLVTLYVQIANTHTFGMHPAAAKPSKAL